MSERTSHLAQAGFLVLAFASGLAIGYPFGLDSATRSAPGTSGPCLSVAEVRDGRPTLPGPVNVCGIVSRIEREGEKWLVGLATRVDEPAGVQGELEAPPTGVVVGDVAILSGTASADARGRLTVATVRRQRR